MATGYGLDDRGFESRQWLGISLFTTVPWLALGPIHPPIHWVPVALSLGVKRPGREADHSPPSSVGGQECVELCLHSNTPSLCGAQLKTHGQVYLYLLVCKGWTIGVLVFNSWRVLGIFLFTTASKTALGPTQSPIQWLPGALSLGVKRVGCEADHSLPSSAEVKEWVELYLHSPNTPPWRGAQLKHRDIFTFYLVVCMLSLCKNSEGKKGMNVTHTHTLPTDQTLKQW
jgi:hypothetical protein